MLRKYEVFKLKHNVCMPYSWVKITDIREKTLMIKACF